jgi:hypothetical protein
MFNGVELLIAYGMLTSLTLAKSQVSITQMQVPEANL